MSTTKISSDQLLFRSAQTGTDTLLDTYLEDAEIGGLSLAQLLTQIFNPGDGSFTGAADPAQMQFRFDPLNPSDLQFRYGIFTSPAEDEVGWVTVGTVPTGSGTGDMLGINNLSDLASPVTAKINLLLGALADLNTVSSTELDNGAVTLPKLANGTPTRVIGFDSGGSPVVITVGGGTTLVGNVISSAPIINDSLFVDTVNYTSGTGTPVGFALPVNPVNAKNIFVTFDGLEQNDGFVFTPTTITFALGIPLLVANVRIRIIT